MKAIPQAFCELDLLAHITVEYSSTLFSYRTMTDILFLLKENIMKQIMNRQEEVKLFQTQQGIGLRQIMLQHYHRVQRKISDEHNIFVQITQTIDQKHKAMQNSINFIGPKIREIQDIFDQTMGKGLERLEKSILQLWILVQNSSFQHLSPQIEIPKLQLQHLNDHQKSESQESLDLSCHQNLEDIMKQPLDLSFVKKKLYESPQCKSIQRIYSNKSQKSIENESEQFEVSPTFKFTCPLIIDSVDDISQFRSSEKQPFPQNQNILFCNSFSKENINTLNL